MTTDPSDDDQRWRDVMRALDPGPNLAAMTDIWRQAAASSERVVSGFLTPDGRPRPPDAGRSRDLRLEVERAIDQVAEGFKHLVTQVPWAPLHNPGPTDAPVSVVVIDGVGTTEVRLPAPVAEPWISELVRHDGARISADAIAFRAMTAVDEQTESACSYIVRIDDPSAAAGTYHGLMLSRSSANFARHVIARVCD
jgi:hypothetical protein